MYFKIREIVIKFLKSILQSPKPQRLRMGITKTKENYCPLKSEKQFFPSKYLECQIKSIK